MRSLSMLPISTVFGRGIRLSRTPARAEWPSEKPGHRRPNLHFLFASLLFVLISPAEPLVANSTGLGERGPLERPVEAVPPPVSQNVLLGLDVAVGVNHDADFFNRRRYLTFKYRTSDELGNVCSDEDLQDVEFVVTLPTEAQFVEARQGGQAVPPTQQTGGTVTWSFGTLDRRAHCDPDTRGTEFEVAISVDPSVADATPLEAVASISTSTAGDDPSDNQARVVFAAVMFPVQVFVKSVLSQCEAAGSVRMSDDGSLIVCSPGQATALVSPTAGPGLFGEVPIEGQAVLPFGVGGLSHPGSQAEGSVESTVEVRNPNLFPLPLRIHFDARFNCHVSDGTSTARPVISGVLTNEAECGFGNLDTMDENLRLHFFADGGPGGVCRTLIRIHSTERGDDISDDVAPSCRHQRLRPAVMTAAGTTPGTMELQLGLRMSDVQGGGWANANARARACISVDHTPPGALGDHCFYQSGTLSIAIFSPADLLLTNASGQRVGRVDDPNLGPISFAEIPGADYSGPGTEPQTINVGLPDAGEYRLTVLGTSDGPYTVTVTTADEDGAVINEQSFVGQASAGSIFQQDILLAPDGRMAIKPAALSAADVAQQLLGASGVLSDDVLRFLDLSGNDNGVFDVGDFRAFLLAGGGGQGVSLPLR